MRWTVSDEFIDGKFKRTIEDENGEWVQYEIEGETAYFLSELADDMEPVTGSCHAADAKAEAFAMMGML